MMQRATSSSRDSDDHHIVDIMQLAQANPRRRMDRFTDFPINDTRSGIGRRENLPSRLFQNLIHTIPVIVLLCLVILWWFSYPVSLEIKDGRLAAIRPIKMPQPLNDTRVDVTILASATAPNASVPLVLTVFNETELQPVSQYD